MKRLMDDYGFYTPECHEIKTKFNKFIRKFIKENLNKFPRSELERLMTEEISYAYTFIVADQEIFKKGKKNGK